MTVPNDYLDTAVDRIVLGYKAVFAAVSVQGVQITKYIDTGKTPPCLWLFPATPDMNTLDPETDIQQLPVAARFVLGKGTENYDGVLMSKLWTLIPAIINYFNKYRELRYEADQAAIYGLIPDYTRVELASGFGQFSGSPFVGIAFQHQLAFNVEIEHVII